MAKKGKPNLTGVPSRLGGKRNPAYAPAFRALKRKSDPLYERHHQLKYQFGLSLEDYYDMLHSQNGGCAICHKPPTAQLLCVDHDHITGKVRGLLCRTCNCAIGLLNDNSEQLMAAALYLERIK